MVMKTIKATSLLVIAGLLFFACHKNSGHLYIKLTNKSNRKIACQEFWCRHITESDTIFQCRIGAVGIPSDSSFLLPSGDAVKGRGWEYDFNTIPYLQLLIMDFETYNTYIYEPCDTVRKYVPVLHVYRLTLEDLQKTNWTVTYPPEKQ